jgi:hypothetical protein
MRAAPPPRLLVLVLVALGVVLAGCGKSGSPQLAGGGPSSQSAQVGAQGVVGVATKNTTRLGGGDPASDAAAVARAVYPGLTGATRPQAVVLVDERNWPASLVASELASAPLGAPLLYADGNALPEATVQALRAMRPVGAAALGGAQVIRVGTSATVPEGYRTRGVPAACDPSAVAATVESLSAGARGGAPAQVIVLASDAPPALQMPAAGLAAESGAPILLITAAAVPPATAAALRSLPRPAIYLLDPSAVGSATLSELARFGPVVRVQGGSGTGTSGTAAEGNGPVENAITVARFTDGSFGWGVKEPGHGLVFASAARPLDAPASAPLSASGDYGPLLLLESPSRVPPALAKYLSDIQPAYSDAPRFRPVRGVYNHGWPIGDERAISAVAQAELDSMLEISPRSAAAKEPSVAPVE